MHLEYNQRFQHLFLALKIQSKTYTVQTTIFWKKLLKLNFEISYLLLPPEGAGAAGRPPWNGAGRFWGGGLLGRLFPPNRLKGFLKNCAEAQAKKSTAKVSNTLMVAKLKNEFQIQNEFSIFSKFFEINLHK